MEKFLKTDRPIDSPTDARRLTGFVKAHPKLVILTGAGISAGSGIPTYRDENGTWLRNEPIQHQAFVDDHGTRQRYWLRSFAGWPAVAAASPSPAHQAIARLEQIGYCRLLVTQNVDRLHQQAGSVNVIDLHGRLDEVVCLHCDAVSTRRQMQERLKQLNPFLTTSGVAQPDGDADVDESQRVRVIVPDCEHCRGMLKPHVVFFGGSVDRDRVDRIYRSIDDADALLVIGSSLKVFSGFRFCRYAEQQGKPIACINPGWTRADPLLTLKISQPADTVLAELVEELEPA